MMSIVVTQRFVEQGNFQVVPMSASRHKRPFHVAHSANEPRQVTKLRQWNVLRSIGCRTTSRSRTGAASYNVVENTGLTMSQQRPSGLLSLGRWTAKA